MKKEIKAWAVIDKKGNIIRDTFFCSEPFKKDPPLLAIFGRVKEKWNPKHGYTLDDEREVEVTITYKIPK